MHRRLLVAAIAVAALLALPSIASAGSSTAPFGHPCSVQDGVRFCPTADLTQRVPSFDGIPLDVDVTLPATGSGPFPTIVMLHGYGGNKTAFEAASAAPGDFNNIGLAKLGYAVLTTSARGFGKSCGSASSRTPDCAKGWIHLADQRYEAHDAQLLLGELVDERIAKADGLGATGGSYGGGQSLELAYLKDRTRNADGSFVPWKSPNGTALKLAAAYPIIPWSDLSDALVPNGRDGSVASLFSPPGVSIKSYVNALYIAGAATGFVAPPGVDAGSDLSTWNDLFNLGEPYGAQAKAIGNEMSKYHGSLQLGNKPSPLLVANGFTDDLFPPAQTLRLIKTLLAKNKKAPIWGQYGDFGHARGGSHAASDKVLRDQGIQFFDHYLMGSKVKMPKPGSVIAFGQSCPRDTPNALGPFKASSFAKLSKSFVTLTNGKTQTVTSTGGDPQLSADINPLAPKGGNACSTYPAAISAGTATATAKSKGFIYLGIGHITATIKTTGLYGQLDARLWDVNAGQQTLVDRSVYRLIANQKGVVSFALHGNGYQFAKGHTVKLELLGNDGPTHRPSNGTFSVKVLNLAAALPSR